VEKIHKALLKIVIIYVSVPIVGALKREDSERTSVPLNG